MKTQLGLVSRSTGDNIPMSGANGVNVESYERCWATCFQWFWCPLWSHVCTKWWFSQMWLLVGTIVVGLSAVIIAEVLIHELTIGWRLLHRGWSHCLQFDYLKYLRDPKSRSRNSSSLQCTFLIVLVRSWGAKRLRVRGLKLGISRRKYGNIIINWRYS